MFEIDDYVVHGCNGVCKVIEIGPLDMAGIDHEKMYYTLQPIFTKGSKVYTPVKCNRAKMRKILSKKEALEIIDDIPNTPTLWVTNEKYLDEQFKESIKKYDCREWIKVIKTIYEKNEERKSQGKKIGTTDERYLLMAEDYLYGEFSISLNVPKEEVESFITSRLS